ncbi:MAG: 23S rRNA pseudouridine(1911/1915/1917) synthase RluD [Pseudomonadota bacterium]|nr:23S rRNA pseudouridine(1911/1915/1917) synthase RluD [Pseudomonadota bacterium]
MTTIDLTTEITEELSGQRLDQVLAKCYPQYSRERFKQWILAGVVTVDGEKMRPRDKVETGQKIILHTQLADAVTSKPEAIALNIVYEDEAIIVLNKPVGLVVHPGAGNQRGTLMNALLHHDPNMATLPRAGIVHRLDKDTSGVMVVARTLEAYTSLVRQLQDRSVRREYDTIVYGKIIAGSTIDAPIARHPHQRLKMAVVDSGKPALTHYRVKERFEHFTRLSVQIETGRTHQIRVHMAYIHHPVVGDPVYGGRLRLPPNTTEAFKDLLRHFNRQALHAASLTLIHPVTEEEMSWQVPLPEDYQQLLSAISLDNKPSN